mmetsp:Transcript_153709/g.271370  ORF Transcript_153709/g.271370 Transcript_153709/m.271370 type:complete len:310 (-) Transcript_153709:145-1074(-)
MPIKFQLAFEGSETSIDSLPSYVSVRPSLEENSSHAKHISLSRHMPGARVIQQFRCERNWAHYFSGLCCGAIFINVGRSAKVCQGDRLQRLMLMGSGKELIRSNIKMDNATLLQLHQGSPQIHCQHGNLLRVCGWATDIDTGRVNKWKHVKAISQSLPAFDKTEDWAVHVWKHYVTRLWRVCDPFFTRPWVHIICSQEVSWQLRMLPKVPADLQLALQTAVCVADLFYNNLLKCAIHISQPGNSRIHFAHAPLSLHRLHGVHINPSPPSVWEPWQKSCWLLRESDGMEAGYIADAYRVSIATFPVVQVS